ncbi:hypothetical protein Tco_0250928 [Tanacetum coccineum]
MLDSYRSFMCMESWGRGSFARALTELDATCELKDRLVVTIPKSEGSGYRMETICVEYEWKPPRCDDDGFQNVKRKTSKGGDWEIQGKSQGSGFTHSLPKQQMPKYAYQKKTTSIPVSNVFSTLKEDNEKPKDASVDDTWKKVEAPPRKTSIWTGRKADSLTRNVMFSLETNVHYFNKDFMELTN